MKWIPFLIREFSQSDVQKNYTLTYVWMANQFGHFFIGFGGLYLLDWVADSIGLDRVSIWWLAGIWLALWLAKEWLWDYRQALREGAGIFDVDSRHVARDAATDSFFYLAGIGLACASTYGDELPLLTFAVCVALAAALAPRWLIEKAALQRIGAPFTYRLSAFPCRPEPLGPEGITQFIQCKGPIKHILLFGPVGSGKTSLATGIVTEEVLLNNVSYSLYTTYFKLLQLLEGQQEAEKLDGREVHDWRRSKTIVIDDVDAGLRSSVVVEPAQINETLEKLPDTNVKLLREKRTIWVLGSEMRLWHEWVEAMTRVLRVEPDEVGIIRLRTPLKPEPTS